MTPSRPPKPSSTPSASRPHLLTVRPPGPLWRVGRLVEPLRFSPPVGIANIKNDVAGSRYDLLAAEFGTMYLATTREGAFAESLAPLIPDPQAVALLPPDDSIGAGFIDANWRATHRVCEVELANSAELPLLDFVDVPNAHNLALLDRVLRPALALLDVSRLNLSVVTSDRRSVTRLIAQYVASILDENYRRRYAGIRYISKHGVNHLLRICITPRRS